MKTQIEKLRELSDKKKSVVMNQYVDDLLRNGKAYTVRSRYSGGYYYKKSYTEELAKISLPPNEYRMNTYFFSGGFAVKCFL